MNHRARSSFQFSLESNFIFGTYPTMPKISAVDLFCGVGGLTNGLIKAGIDVRAGFDIDESCKYGYEYNNNTKFYSRDVKSLSGKELAAWYPAGSIKLLAGCAPCQPFSTYSQGRNVKNDKKWPLLYEFARLIRELNPELVTMENVPDVIKHEVYQDFVESLKNDGYQVWADKIYCPELGIPQVRSRHVLLASRIGAIKLNTRKRKPTEFKTVKDAIGMLPPIAAGEQHPEDPLHMASALSSINMERMKYSSPGGTWRDWPDRLIAECHRRASGKSYSGVYARMRPDAPAPTMTTQCYGFGNGRFGHPTQDRGISLREAAIFQTFPKRYRFTEPGKPIKFKSVGRMIGNAVPPRLGEVIGKSFIRHLANK